MLDTGLASMEQYSRCKTYHAACQGHHLIAWLLQHRIAQTLEEADMVGSMLLRADLIRGVRECDSTFHHDGLFRLSSAHSEAAAETQVADWLEIVNSGLFGMGRTTRFWFEWDFERETWIGTSAKGTRLEVKLYSILSMYAAASPLDFEIRTSTSVYHCRCPSPHACRQWLRRLSVLPCSCRSFAVHAALLRPRDKNHTLAHFRLSQATLWRHVKAALTCPRIVDNIDMLFDRVEIQTMLYRFKQGIAKITDVHERWVDETRVLAQHLCAVCSTQLDSAMQQHVWDRAVSFVLSPIRESYAALYSKQDAARTALCAKWTLFDAQQLLPDPLRPISDLIPEYASTLDSIVSLPSLALAHARISSILDDTTFRLPAHCLSSDDTILLFAASLSQSTHPRLASFLHLLLATSPDFALTSLHVALAFLLGPPS